MVSEYHIPVFLEECLDALAIRSGGAYLDCTMGGGGHFLEIIKRLNGCGTAIGVDRDDQAIARVQEKLDALPVGVRAFTCHQPFSHLDVAVKSAGLTGVDGILMDLGVSSHQFDAAERGFSYRGDATLDMRMDRRDTLSAAELVNTASEEELLCILREYGEIQNPRRMVKVLVDGRKKSPIMTTGDLVSVLNQEYGDLKKSVLSKVFQGFRIAVNNELAELETALELSGRCLNPGGRLVIISYHSLEDRRVKNYMRDNAKSCVCPAHLPQCVCGGVAQFRLITRKAILPSEEEIERNRRARSAKLRVAERLGHA